MFTGGSLLHGSAGRPDLFGAAHTHALAAAQHTSVRRLATNLPAQAAVYPTHGFGSFRAPAGPGADGSTIGEERRVNPALALDEDAYIAWLLAGLDDYPAYYAQMGPANAAGPAAPDLALAAVSGTALTLIGESPGQVADAKRDLTRILHAAGHAVTAIDDDFSRAALTGLPLSTGPAANSPGSAPASHLRHRVPFGP